MSTQQPTLRLDGELTIYQVGARYDELHLALQQCLAQEIAPEQSEQQPTITIDTSDLIEVDSAGLQLLVQLTQRARQTDIAVHWQTPSAALTQMIELYNAAQWFENSSEARQS